MSNLAKAVILIFCLDIAYAIINAVIGEWQSVFLALSSIFTLIFVWLIAWVLRKTSTKDLEK